MELALEGKVVILTGVTGGIGRQIALDFLLEGAIVIGLIRNENKMQKIRNWITEQNVSDKSLHSKVGDLFDYQGLQKVVREIVDEFHRVDVLVNCAGFAHENPFAILDQDQIDSMIDVNFKSPLYLSHAVLRPMFRQKEGCIINISSVSAIKKGRGVAVYAAAKAAMDAFTRALSSEVGRKNIRVNCIRPGVINTTMSGPLLERAHDIVTASTALSRFGYPNEISKAVLFIASNNTASYMTGETFTIDGGMF